VAFIDGNQHNFISCRTAAPGGQEKSPLTMRALADNSW
jgi:hypothetical protein